jgi:SAM-dependent methyltransferase
LSENRFGRTADRMAAEQDARAAATRERLRRLLAPRGDERVLDAGTGAGAFAIALAPLVREVVGVDIVPELLAEGRKRAPANVELVEADAGSLPYDDDSFDLVCTSRTLHHAERPDLIVAELARVLRPGGTALVVDQLAPDEPEAAAALLRFEQARDDSTTRLLTDGELRALLAANGLELREVEHDREPRDLDRYLDLAGCEGDARERAQALAPPGYAAEVGWYLATSGLPTGRSGP